MELELMVGRKQHPTLPTRATMATMGQEWAMKHLEECPLTTSY